jgi:cysteine desulfurase/selenocysteine lyase
MSIPRLETASLPTGTATPAHEDPFDTALIARLANEFFSDRASAAPTAEGLPEAPAPVPSAPTALAGVPTALPSQGGSAPATVPGFFPNPEAEVPTTIPEISSGSAGDHGLSGGFPTTSAAEPVHPVVAPGEPEPKPSEPAPMSGGHDPKSGDSYAFGEPRCNGTTFGQSVVEPTAKPTAATQPAPPFGSSFVPGIEVIEAPDFYFLQPPASGVKSPLPGTNRQSSTPALSVFDIEAIRRDFPALHQRVNGHPLIWLDNAATTQKPQAVIDATSHFYARDNSNIHRAAHTVSERATQAFEAGREKVRQFLGAGDKKEIVFLRGTTEAINLVAQSYGKANIGQGDEIILTELEHHANIVPWQMLAEQVGAVIRVIPINDRGELILEEYVKLLGPRTKIVSVAHVSNSLGTVNPIEEIIPLAHARGVPVLVDGAQSTPHIPINVSALDVDFFVFSAHKIFGPTGVGALYGKSHLLEAMPPYQGGGHMIEDVRFEKTIYRHAPEKFEAGTPDIAGVVGLGAAIDYLTTVGLGPIATYEHALLEYATQALATVPGLRPIGTAQEKASVLSFVIPGVSNDSIARHLDKHGIAVRAGHHCALPAQRHFGLESTVRPSLAFYNTYEEVDALVSVLHQLPRK